MNGRREYTIGKIIPQISPSPCQLEALLWLHPSRWGSTWHPGPRGSQSPMVQLCAELCLRGQPRDRRPSSQHPCGMCSTGGASGASGGSCRKWRSEEHDGAGNAGRKGPGIRSLLESREPCSEALVCLSETLNLLQRHVLLSGI